MNILNMFDIKIKMCSFLIGYFSCQKLPFMKQLIIFIAFIFSVTASVRKNQIHLTRREERQGWKLLFDGKTTQGWHTYLRDTVGSKWQVKNDALVFDTSKPRNGGGDIVTNEAFENFELHLEWKISKGGNSGIIFDIQEDPKYPATYVTGPEMQVLDNIDASDNKKQNHLAGCLYDLAGDSTVSKPHTAGRVEPGGYPAEQGPSYPYTQWHQNIRWHNRQ
jgi:hypothetical protein